MIDMETILFSILMVTVIALPVAIILAVVDQIIKSRRPQFRWLGRLK